MNSKIVSIEEVGEMETVDITVEDEHCFWANGIYTHNSGMSNSDPEMTDIAEAIGIAFTGDLVVAVLENDELKNKNQYLLKQLKNRYTPIKPQFERWLMGVNKDRQQIYEIAMPQEGLKEINMQPQHSEDEMKIEDLTKNINSDDDVVYSNFKF